MNGPIPIIIDTDPGSDIDDIYALAYALLRPELRVLGITTVHGRTDLRAALAQRLLQVLERDDVTVAAGESVPLNLRDESVRHHLLRAVPNHCFPEDEGAEFPPAIDYLLDTVDARPGEIGVCAVGPFTNLGRALQRDPDFGRKCRFIALMGMETRLNRGEHNCATDPEASDLVVRSGARLFIGTWDVTRGVVFTPPVLEQMAAAQSPVADFLLDRTGLWLPLQETKPGPVLYDVAPITWAFAPEMFTTQPGRVRIELTGKWTRGWSVLTNGHANAEVTTDMDVVAVSALVFETITEGVKLERKDGCK